MRWAIIRIVSIVGFLVGLYAASHVLEYNLQDYVFQILISCGINVTLAVSLNLINGITGQFSIGHAGFMAVGGYASVYVTCYLLYAIYGADAPRVLSSGGVPAVTGAL